MKPSVRGTERGEQSEAMLPPFLSSDPSVSLYIFYPREKKRAYAQIKGRDNLDSMRMPQEDWMLQIFIHRKKVLKLLKFSLDIYILSSFFCVTS